jgi:hypothetical protein
MSYSKHQIGYQNLYKLSRGHKPWNAEQRVRFRRFEFEKTENPAS